MVTTSQNEFYQEIELKLQLLNEATGELLWSNPYVKNGLTSPPETKDLFSVYYDTRDHHLLKQGFTLRVRKDNGTYTLTIKKMGNAAGGLHQRAEWNYPLPSEAPSLEYIEDQELRERLNSVLKDRTLAALMTTAFKRTQSNWQDKDGNLLELAIDEGQIETEKSVEIIREVELELKRGQTTALLAMGEQLALSLPMIPGNKSKFYRGLQMLELDNEKVTSKKTLEPKQLPIKDNGLGKAIPMLLEEAFYQVLVYYERLCQHEITVEEVHQIRVSSRHARSLLIFFKPALTEESSKPLGNEFKSLATNFGKLREVQVMKYHFNQSPCVGFCGQLEEIINEEVGKELQAMRKTIKSGTLTPLVLRLWRLVMTLQVKEAYENQSISLFAEERLAAWQEKCNRRQLKLSPGDMNRLHQQRIRVKRIRYAADWLRPVLSKKAAKTIKTSKAQQEIMGELHDIYCERTKLREWIDRREPTVNIMYQLGFYEGWQERQKHHLWETLFSQLMKG